VGGDRLRGAECFLPGSNPCFIEIARFIPRVAQNDGCLYGGGRCCTQEWPERPVRRIESGNQQIAEAWRIFVRCFDGCAIGSMAPLKFAFFGELVKIGGDLTQRRRPRILKTPARAAQLIDRAKQMIGRARD